MEASRPRVLFYDDQSAYLADRLPEGGKFLRKTRAGEGNEGPSLVHLPHNINEISFAPTVFLSDMIERQRRGPSLRKATMASEI